MKKFLSVFLVFAAGCAAHRTVDVTDSITHDLSNSNLVTQSKDRTTHVGISIFNKTAIEGLTIGKRTAKETTTLSLGKAQTETQAEAIKATGEALGAGLAAGIKKSLIP